MWYMCEYRYCIQCAVGSVLRAISWREAERTLTPEGASRETESQRPALHDRPGSTGAVGG